MSIKTNKSLTKRLKITKKGKILSRAPGFNHFNAKQSRTKQLGGKKMNRMPLTNKITRTYLPNASV
ncbi:MAG TPA: 50S ribosomal protein L35 [Candidatus Paceibacterota bacterium]|jgi:ribosomal protein L35|nr:50S ribosomal protein L35 [Candidatus Paceibacterota bacterium]